MGEERERDGDKQAEESGGEGLDTRGDSDGGGEKGGVKGVLGAGLGEHERGCSAKGFWGHPEPPHTPPEDIGLGFTWEGEAKGLRERLGGVGGERSCMRFGTGPVPGTPPSIPGVANNPKEPLKELAPEREKG